MRNLFLVIIVLSSQLSFSQAWTKKKGSGYEQIGVSYIKNNRIYNRDGNELQLNRAVTDITLNEYLEYGITDKITVSVIVPYKMVSTSTEIYEKGYLPDTLSSGNMSGLSNTSLSLIYGLKQEGNWVSSIKLKTDLPTAQYDNEIGLRTGSDALGVSSSILFGKSKKNNFGTFEIGANYRTNNYSTQLFSSAQIGKKVKDKLYTILVLDYLKPLKNGTFNDGNSIHTGLYMNDIEWTAFTLKLGYLLTDKIIIWSAIGGGVSGHVVARAPSFSFALSYEW